MKAPNVKATIMEALENGAILTNGSANTLTKSTEGGRTIRQLRQDGYPISERLRPNILRSGMIKEFFLTPEAIAVLREKRDSKQGNLFEN